MGNHKFLLGISVCKYKQNKFHDIYYVILFLKIISFMECRSRIFITEHVMTLSIYTKNLSTMSPTGIKISDKLLISMNISRNKGSASPVLKDNTLSENYYIFRLRFGHPTHVISENHFYSK